MRNFRTPLRINFNTSWRILSFASFLFALTVALPSRAPSLPEVLLSGSAAYNPIPSPNGKMIAYVRTGWGREGGSGGFGRSNLVSEVMVMTENGTTISATPPVSISRCVLPQHHTLMLGELIISDNCHTDDALPPQPLNGSIAKESQ